MSNSFFKFVKFDTKERRNISISTVRDLSYYSVFNATKQEAFSFGSTENNISRIYQNYAEKEISRFRGKFGTSPEEFLNKTQLAQTIYETQNDFLEQMESADISFKKVSKEARNATTVLKDIQENKANAEQSLQRSLKAVEAWQKTTQEYLDLMAKVDPAYAKNHQGDFEVTKAKTPSGNPIGSLRLDSKAFTSYESASLLLDELEKRISAVGTEVDKIKDLKLVTHKVSKGSFVKTPSGAKKQQTIDFKTAMTKMNGYIASIKGTIFELSVASALESTLNELFTEVKMMGNEKGVKVKESGINFQTSKTDVKAKIEGFEVNLSIKNQSHSKLGAFGTKAMVTTMYNMIRLTAQSDIEALQLASVFYTNPEMRKTTSKLNHFLAALVADMAIGSGGNDRIDFMVYNDQIVPMATFLADLDGKVKMTLGNPNNNDIWEVLRGVKSISGLNLTTELRILPGK